MADGPTLADQSGAGIFVSTGGPTLNRLIVWYNTAQAFGGGIENILATTTITSSTIAFNRASEGGGACNEQSSAPYRGVNFQNNYAAGGGGAIFNLGVGTTTVTNSSFFDNVADVWAGAIANSVDNTS